MNLLELLNNEVLLSAVPVVMVLLSLAAALLIFPLPDHATRTRITINLTFAAAKVGLVFLLLPVIFYEELRPEFSIPLLPGIDFVLRVDPLALLFAILSSVLWLVTTVYAIGYLGKGEDRSRFFGFFSLCVTASVGISFSGNLVTFLIFYELLTVVTYPLVAHWGTPAALKAARLYLRYTLSGGLVLLIGVVALTVYAGPVDFSPGGADGVSALAAAQPGIATVIFLVLIAGLGVKAALVPLHGWLPEAMVAPAPVSALLHAVAVVKAGVFGIVRVVDDVYGIEVITDLGVHVPLVIAAAVTILYGSYQALRQSDLKRRLAYSTVSQVSYVTIGVALAVPAGIAGGVVHLVHQGIMKITLFFAAGLYAEVAGAKKIEELSGLGPRMRLTSTAFTLGAFGMIGLPPTAGFISKWMLGIGAVDSEFPWVLAVLVASSLLNAAYFLPIVYRLWFGEAKDDSANADESAESVPEETAAAGSGVAVAATRTVPGLRMKEPGLMSWPVILCAGAILVFGLGASVPYLPLDLAQRIAEGVF